MTLYSPLYPGSVFEESNKKLLYVDYLSLSPVLTALIDLV